MTLTGRCLVSSLALCAITPLGALAGSADPRIILVRTTPFADRAAAFSNLHIQHESALVPGLAVARVHDTESVDAALTRLRATPGVLYAEPDRVLVHAANSPKQISPLLLAERGGRGVGFFPMPSELAPFESNREPGRPRPGAVAHLTPEPLAAASTTGAGTPRLAAVSSLTIASTTPPSQLPAPTALAATPTFNLNMINAPAAWPSYGKGSGVKVAVLDTGLDFAHTGMPTPAASASFVPGQSADDYNFHGTHCAGTIVGKDSIFGSFSVAPDATLLVGKVVCDGGWGALSWLIEGIDWSVTQGASVISMSLSSDETSQALADSCQAAFDAGVVLVAAAGNESVNTPRYPAAYPSVIAVGALNAGAAHSTFSNTGPHLSVSAPGENIPSAIPLPTSFVSWSAGSKKASQFTGSFGGSVSAQVVHCGEGSPAEIPAGVAGKIAHIRRSNTLTFAEQFGNAAAAGAIGVVISNNAPDALIQDSLAPNFLFLPCVLISQADGDALLAVTTETITIGQGYSGHFFGVLTGTSQATPHAAGVATLLRAAFKPAVIEPRAIRFAIEHTANDIDAPGFDESTGHGLLNAKAAADYFSGRIRCKGDLNNDNQVDDTDFSLFAVSYDDLLSPAGTYTGADLTGDGLCDDTDFQQFVQFYDALLCP